MPSNISWNWSICDATANATQEPDEHRRAAERRRRLRVHAARARASRSRRCGARSAASTNVRRNVTTRGDPGDDRVAGHAAPLRLRSELGVRRELRRRGGRRRRATSAATCVVVDVARARGAISDGDLAPSRARAMPAVVTAAVPRRRPLVTNGFSGSFGIAFLLQVIPAASSASCATLPVTPKGRRSTSMRWLSVPPDTMRKPSAASASASAAALRTICGGVLAELGLQRLAGTRPPSPRPRA